MNLNALIENFNMSHYKLLMAIINKFDIRKKRYLAKKIGYSPHQIYRWINKGENLVLTFRALQELCKVAEELKIEVDKNELL